MYFEFFKSPVNGKVSELEVGTVGDPRLVAATMTKLANNYFWQKTGNYSYGKYWQFIGNSNAKMANSNGNTANYVRLIILTIGVCHDNSAKADLWHQSH